MWSFTFAICYKLLHDPHFFPPQNTCKQRKCIGKPIHTATKSISNSMCMAFRSYGLEKMLFIGFISFYFQYFSLVFLIEIRYELVFFTWTWNPNWYPFKLRKRERERKSISEDNLIENFFVQISLWIFFCIFISCHVKLIRLKSFFWEFHSPHFISTQYSYW